MAKISPEAQLIIDVARTDHGPDAEHRRRLREQLLQRANAPESRIQVASRGRTIGLLTGGAVLVSALFVTLTQRAPAPIVSRSLPSHNESVATPPIPDPAPVSSSVIEGAPEEVVPASPKPVAVDRLPAVRPVKATPALPKAEASANGPRTGMSDEMRILREAHAALKSGDLAVARARLNEHTTNFPHGIFREERMTLSALVYCAEGRRADARREAEALASEHPNSSHLERLRGSCAAE